MNEGMDGMHELFFLFVSLVRTLDSKIKMGSL
jgi:hypothetical protein